MPILTPSRSAPIPSSPPRPQLPRGRSNTASRHHIHRIFSAQHLDDTSNYHDGDHDSNYHEKDNETESLDELEQVRDEDYDEAERNGEDEVSEVRMGILDTKDLEANLEKRQTTRSVKDPNLVRAIGYDPWKMTA